MLRENGFDLHFSLQNMAEKRSFEIYSHSGLLSLWPTLTLGCSHSGLLSLWPTLTLGFSVYTFFTSPRSGEVGRGSGRVGLSAGASRSCADVVVVLAFRP